ncbi:MlaD family protein [Nocardioides daejeonensis]|uniref:MlaD family protein n=1 Tax=Nocardioides daejeonensis TaxID=1046556 RepID=UPI000D74DF0A|nr:MlaD family protein [Nocardioides daejeonensis]
MKNVMNGVGGRVAVLVAFLAVCGLAFAWLLGGTGIKRPFLDADEYTATVTIKDVDNLVHASQVQIAGVKVGGVREVEQTSDGLKVTFTVDDEVAPLHDGVQVRVGERSLVGETYLALTDGDGPALRSGAALPDKAVQPSVQLRDVMADLDPETREKAGKLLRSLGKGTTGAGPSVDRLLDGLGDLGAEGHTALDAIAAQSDDLELLARQTTQVLDALDTGQGLLATLVGDANRLTRATAGQSAAIAATMRQAPEVLDQAKVATRSLTGLAAALDPVAADLRASAPDLTTALRELPATTADLDGMLAPLSGVLDRAPGTLKRVPTFSRDVSDISPTALGTLADVNPMLAYIEPYGPELAAYFANFNAVLNYRDESGAYYLRLTPLVNTHSPQLPISTNGLLGNYQNAYPAPGTGATPGPFKGEYPRILRQGN